MVGVERPPRVLGVRYELVEVVGRGAMGEVWVAQDLRLDRRVAVKVLRAPVASDPALRARFGAEARAAARLSHPNVVTVFDSGEQGGTPFLVMELLPGRTLADELAQGPLSPERAQTVGLEVLGGLAASHRAGILHRDIKPANVLLAEDGTARLADFGIAKSIEGGDATATGLILGTVAYLAPERLAGGAATAQSDLYAVGAVLYEALAGRKPFTAETPFAVLGAIDQHPPPPLCDVRPELDPALAAAVERALARDPSDRFGSAGEMADAIGAPSRWNDHGTPPAATAPTVAMTAPVDASPTKALTSPVASPTTRHEAPRPNASDRRRGVDQRRWRQRRTVVLACVVGVVVVMLLIVAAHSLRSPDGDEPAATADPPAATTSIPAALDDALTALEDAVRS
jgi:serine/threonine protein kinase